MGFYVDTMDKGVLGILRFALSREVEGMNFYKEKVKDVKDSEVKEALEQLSGMEDGHVNYITELIKNVEKGNSVSVVNPPRQDMSFFKNREKKELTGGKIDDIASVLSVLRMAYLIEDDFMHFYDESAEKLEDKAAKKILKALSSWEKEHWDMLYALYEERSKEYWDEMGFTPLF